MANLAKEGALATYGEWRPRRSLSARTRGGKGRPLPPRIRRRATDGYRTNGIVSG